MSDIQIPLDLVYDKELVLSYYDGNEHTELPNTFTTDGDGDGDYLELVHIRTSSANISKYNIEVKVNSHHRTSCDLTPEEAVRLACCILSTELSNNGVTDDE